MASLSVAKGTPPLVHDVIDLILEYLYYMDNSSRPDIRALGRYSRISRAWRLPAQILLFRQVRIRSQHDLSSLEYNFSGLGYGGMRHAKLLRHSVRVLRIRLGGQRDDGSSLWGTDAIHPEQLPRCLKLFPYLYELRINIQRIRKLDNTVLQELTNTPPIQSLMIYKPTFLNNVTYPNYIPVQVTIHFQLLQIHTWPLRYFSICGDIASGSIAGFKRPIHLFKAIRLDIPLYSYEARMIRWLLSQSLDTIENLSIPQFGPLIQKVASRLKSFECCYADSNFHSVLPLPKCKEILWFQMPNTFLSRPGDDFARGVPTGIVHLGLSARNTRLSIAWWEDLGRVLPETLKRVSVVDYTALLPTSSDISEDRKMISDALGGVEVRLFANLKEYKKTTPVCMLPDKSFPQEPSISDFHTMTRLVSDIHDGTVKVSTSTSPTSQPVARSKKSSVLGKSSRHSINKPLKWR